MKLIADNLRITKQEIRKALKDLEPLKLERIYPLQKNIMWILWGSYCILAAGCQRMKLKK